MKINDETRGAKPLAKGQAFSAFAEKVLSGPPAPKAGFAPLSLI